MNCPEGYSFSKTKSGLIACHDPSGKIIHYSGDTETAIACIPCHQGEARRHKVDKYVEL